MSRELLTAILESCNGEQSYTGSLKDLLDRPAGSTCEQLLLVDLVNLYNSDKL